MKAAMRRASADPQDIDRHVKEFLLHNKPIPEEK